MRTSMIDSVMSSDVDVTNIYLRLTMDIPGMQMAANANLESTGQPVVFTGDIRSSMSGEWIARLGVVKSGVLKEIDFTLFVDP